MITKIREAMGKIHETTGKCPTKITMNSDTAHAIISDELFPGLPETKKAAISGASMKELFGMELRINSLLNEDFVLE